MKQRIVIKVGTSSLLTSNEQPRGTFNTVADGVKDLSHEYDVALVSSGAIGFGVRKMELAERPKETSELQALSAIGQVGLMTFWQNAFGDDAAVSQILLTARELRQERPLAEFKTTLSSLWTMGAIPIINENDAITNEEISLGDNDQLAASVATCADASRLVLLTDMDGIQRDFGGTKQSRIERIAVAEVAEHIDTRSTAFGTGGMTTKLAAARIALGNGIRTYIGNANSPIADILTGKSGTEIV